MCNLTHDQEAECGLEHRQIIKVHGSQFATLIAENLAVVRLKKLPGHISS